MRRSRKIDSATTIVPMGIILVLCIMFVLFPAASTNALGAIRTFLENKLGVYYLFVGLAVLLTGIWIAFSDIGKIRLGGQDQKPQYSFFTWGSMMFTAGLAADILFYSFCEWILYANEPRIKALGSMQDWSSTFPLFHWGPIPWSFYAVLAAAFGFMLHIRGVKKQKYSEACRAILGKHTDGVPGRIIDVLAVFALIAGTATTFSLATPLLSGALTDLLGLQASKWLSIAILLFICAVYTVSVLKGMQGVRFLAEICMYVFFALLLYVFILGKNPIYIIETGFQAIGNMLQNFIGLSSYVDPLRESGFAQNWTIFYWAYWMVWCVAAPFFMGSISKGRTIKELILGCFVFGISSTYISFIVLGNFSLGLQVTGKMDVIAAYNASGDLYQTIISVIHTLPAPQIALVLMIVSMVAFYATSFDSITLVACAYSYREVKEGEEASSTMKLFWALLLILLPIVLIFSQSSMNNLQTVSMIAAFPIAIVIVLIIASFIKDAKSYIKKIEQIK